MKNRFHPIFVLAVAAISTSGSFPQATLASPISRNAYYAPSPLAGVRKQLSLATADLTRAVAAASKNDAMADEVKAAQAAVNRAKKDYADAMAGCRQQLASDPHIGPLQKTVRELEQRMRDEKDIDLRLGIAGELMVARNKMNTAEWDVMGVDPDLAVTKVAITEATSALRMAQSRRQTTLQQDPAVLAAKQRVDALRRQLAGR